MKIPEAEKSGTAILERMKTNTTLMTLENPIVQGKVHYKFCFGITQ